MEQGVDGKSSLYCCVQRSCNNLNSSVLCKPPFSGLDISFFSFCTIRFKVNSIKTLLFRADNLSYNYHLYPYWVRFSDDFFFVINGFHLILSSLNSEKTRPSAFPRLLINLMSSLSFTSLFYMSALNQISQQGNLPAYF